MEGEAASSAAWSAAPPASGRLGSSLAALRRAVEAERDRWFLWLPLFLGAGIGLYFSLTVEPPLWAGLVAAPLAVAAALIARWRGRLLPAAIAVAAVAVGFAAAELETWVVEAPVLARRAGPAMVEGRVVEAEPLPAGRRIVVEPTRIGSLAPEKLPARVRIKLREGEGAPLPGEGISVRAVLLPPPAPAMPGAYDFQRRAFFDRLGAVGYAVGPVRDLPGEAPSAWRIRLASLRAAMTARIQAALPGRTGAIAAAIITGETHAIPEADAQAFRDAGLAHILVIAGLHMGMVAGLAFFAIRAGLALIPFVALRLNTKKWAASAALVVTFIYLLLSGITVSSRRSFVMTALVLLAVLMDRLSLSARALAWAALVIMLWSPYSVTGPSFQMSFAAVAGLVAFYETFRERITSWYAEAGPGRRLALHVLGGVFTTIVTTVATTPFTVFHFNRFPVYSVAANVIAVPITGLWVMPWGILACLLMPFGLEGAALVPMGWGIDAIAEVARAVTAWPGAAVTLPSMPVWGLMLLSLGAFWLCVWRRRWRLLGLAPILAGYLTLLLPRPPDVLVDSESRVMAVRGRDGAYLISGNARAGLAEETWTRRGAVGAATPWPKSGSSDDGTLACDVQACLYRVRGKVVALERGDGGLAEDCGTVDLAVTPVPVRQPCGTTRVIDRFDTWRDGSYAIWLDPDRMVIESVRDWRGDRPWTPARPPPRS